MLALPFSRELRSALGFAPSPILVGPQSVCLNLNKSPDLAALDPDQVFRDFGLQGASRLVLIDDLLAHGEYSVAYDLTTYLASSPTEFPRGRSDHAKKAVGLSLETMTFLREVAALAAIQAGLYRRAYVTLLQARQLLLAIPSTSRVKLMLEANRHLLVARLAQVQVLPVIALKEIKKAEALYKQAGAVPAGMDLLIARSETISSPASALRRLKKMSTSDYDGSADNVFGPLAEHYYYYLLGRVHLKLERWDHAHTAFEVALNRLRDNKHTTVSNPVREAFLRLGFARVKVGRGQLSPDGAREFEQGLKELRGVIGQFRKLGYVPGEYEAFLHWLKQADMTLQSAAATVQYHKDLHDLAKRSEVLRQVLHSGFSYAKHLFDYGRPNAARGVLDRLMKLAHHRRRDGSFELELKEDPIWTSCQTLQDVTKDALNNSIAPLALWGLSRYAQDELNFVEQVTRDDDAGIVSVYGPKGSGRRILLDRIAKARNSGEATLAILVGVNRSPRAVRSELADLIARHAAIVLYDLNLWTPEVQQEVAETIDQHPSHLGKIYAALSERLEVAEHKNVIVQGLLRLLQPGLTWNIEPLTTRPQDTLVLARGLLINALIVRGHAPAEVMPLIFTSAAANFIRDKYTEVRDLSYAMKILARGLRLEFDVFDSDDSSVQYKEVPHEVVSRMLAQETMDPSAISGRTIARPAPGDLLTASERLVRELAVKYNGKLRDLATQHHIARTTLIRAWKTSGLLKIWYEAGGRKHGEA
jgi:tetratricopeptide (TPR) repeat protein